MLTDLVQARGGAPGRRARDRRPPAAGGRLLLDHRRAAVAGARGHLAGRDGGREPPRAPRGVAARGRGAAAGPCAAGADDGAGLAGAAAPARRTGGRAPVCRAGGGAELRARPAAVRDIDVVAYAADPVKRRLDFILETWQRARRGDETLVVTGIDRVADVPGVRFTGRLPPDEFRALLRRARVFVAASRREDFGIAQLEALADGAMLVTTPAPGPVSGAGAGPGARSRGWWPRTSRPRCGPRWTTPRSATPRGPRSWWRRSAAKRWPQRSANTFCRVCCQDGARDRARSHPQPGVERLQHRAVLLSRLRDLLRVRGRGGDLHLAPALAPRRGGPGALLRDRDVGVPGRADRRADLLRHHHAQSDPRPLVGDLRDLAGRPGHLGRHRRRRRRGPVGRPPPAGPRRPAALHGRRGAGAARGPGDRADRQLLQPGAVRGAVVAALGAEDLSRPPAAGLPPRAHVRAHLPLRAHLEPGGWRRSWCGSARGARSGRPACSRCTWPATRAFASSRRPSGSTTPTTSWGCGSTSSSPACSA